MTNLPLLSVRSWNKGISFYILMSALHIPAIESDEHSSLVLSLPIISKSCIQHINDEYTTGKSRIHRWYPIPIAAGFVLFVIPPCFKGTIFYTSPKDDSWLELLKIDSNSSIPVGRLFCGSLNRCSFMYKRDNTFNRGAKSFYSSHFIVLFALLLISRYPARDMAYTPANTFYIDRTDAYIMRAFLCCQDPWGMIFNELIQ